jgi:hypothetical protein
MEPEVADFHIKYMLAEKLRVTSKNVFGRLTPGLSLV